MTRVTARQQYLFIKTDGSRVVWQWNWAVGLSMPLDMLDETISNFHYFAEHSHVDYGGLSEKMFVRHLKTNWCGAEHAV